MQTTNSNTWYSVKDHEQIDSPALLVYEDRVLHNIRSAIELVGDPARLRPHVKTHKNKEVAGMMMQAGIHQFKCATIAEAEMLANCGAADVLLAYQPIGPKLTRFISLVKAWPTTRFSCLADNLNAASTMAQAASAAQIPLGIFIDLNIGMNRTGIAPEHAMPLIAFCMEQEWFSLNGLHAYDGHLRNPIPEARKQACDECFSRVRSLQQQVLQEHNSLLPIVAGGSPSFSIHANREEDVVCSPGTFVYWDGGYSAAFPEQPFLPAALVMTRIVSLPAEGIICTDLGHKSIAAENPINQRVSFINAPSLEAIAQSEEHLVLRAPANHSWQPGNILYGLPYHVCPTCALYERAHIIRENEWVGEWKNIARDRKISF